MILLPIATAVKVIITQAGWIAAARAAATIYNACKKD